MCLASNTSVEITPAAAAPEDSLAQVEAQVQEWLAGSTCTETSVDDIPSDCEDGDWDTEWGSELVLGDGSDWMFAERGELKGSKMNKVSRRKGCAGQK